MEIQNNISLYLAVSLSPFCSLAGDIANSSTLPWKKKTYLFVTAQYRVIVYCESNSDDNRD